jgi:hypothetical protein
VATVDTNALRELVREYEWIHLALGMLGNLLFFVDSVLFLFETVKVLDVWAFVVGSLLMLVRSVGNVLAREVRGDS